MVEIPHYQRGKQFADNSLPIEMKQKILITSLCGSLALSAAAPILAAGDITVSTPHRMPGSMASNLYFGAQLANASYKETDDSSAAFGLFGGYHLNAVLAVEAAYNDFGEAKKSGIKADASAFSLGMVGKLPIKTDLTLFGKVGLSAWDIDISPGSASDSGTDVYHHVVRLWPGDLSAGVDVRLQRR